MNYPKKWNAFKISIPIFIEKFLYSKNETHSNLLSISSVHKEKIGTIQELSHNSWKSISMN